MKRLIYFLLFIFLINNSIFAACTDSIINQLFTQLQPNVPWLDINPTDFPSACQFTIRYYPCETPIDSLLWKAVATLRLRCLYIPGVHTHIEGYCAVKNVLLTCY